MSNTKTKRLVLSAIMIALSTVLSLIKVWKMPLGGSVTLLSMLPVILISMKYGPKWGLLTTFLYSVVQLALDLGEAMGWGLTGGQWVGMVAFDYIIPYTILGLAGIFAYNACKKGVKDPYSLKYVIPGIVLVMVLRFISHFISGAIVFAVWMPEDWSNSYLYSIVYNGTYMLPEMIFTAIGASVLFKVKETKRLLSAE